MQLGMIGLGRMGEPAAAWVMVPAAVTGSTVETLASCMAAGDIIVDGGNSYYRDTTSTAVPEKPSGWAAR